MDWARGFSGSDSPRPAPQLWGITNAKGLALGEPERGLSCWNKWWQAGSISDGSAGYSVSLSSKGEAIHTASRSTGRGSAGAIPRVTPMRLQPDWPLVPFLCPLKSGLAFRMHFKCLTFKVVFSTPHKIEQNFLSFQLLKQIAWISVYMYSVLITVSRLPLPLSPVCDTPGGEGMYPVHVCNLLLLTPPPST